ncbi:hypothetical protein HK100_004008 [Physocladia obscura]|uniref:Citrate synthase n=1 Tax=Physocladia obscura TaxID=109957 RepID=A0AAD5XJ68_9FUNG|nr:hypothetical protein HK100_004008 [Physocladia obscura]
MTNNEQQFLIVTDKTTGVEIRVPINARFGTVPAAAFAGLKIAQTTPAPDQPQLVPLRILDVGFKNTVVCSSSVSKLNASDGVLRYRGYAVSDLVENSSFLEVAHLLSKLAAVSVTQSDNWTNAVLSHTYLHAELEKQMTTFRYDAHPMGMLIATVASLSTFHPEANPALQGDSMYMLPKSRVTVQDEKQATKALANRSRAILRILGKVPTIASYAYRNRIGRTYNAPMPNCKNYAENFLYMIDKLNEPNYIPDARIVKILDKMFILLAEHGSNCSTITMRHLASSGVDPYTALSGSFGALFGERKSSAVMGMLNLIGSVENIPSFLNLVKEKKTIIRTAAGTLEALPTAAATTTQLKPTRLQGFGHRIYKGVDPRVSICRNLAYELFAILNPSAGTDAALPPSAELAIALETAALSDPWFRARSLYPNIDFWCAVVFDTLGFPPDMFPVLTAIPRSAGFIAHWMESLDDPEYKIYRPRQIFNGVFVRDYVVDREAIDGVDGDGGINGGVGDGVIGGEESGYAKSLPAQANKRLSLNSAALSIDNIEDAKLAEFRVMIDRTRAAIQDLSILTSSSSSKPAGIAEIPMPGRKSSMSLSTSAVGSSSSAVQTRARLAAWMFGKNHNGIESSSGSSGATVYPSDISEKLGKTQAELQDLLEKQQELLELYVGHRQQQTVAAAVAATSVSGSSGNSAAATDAITNVGVSNGNGNGGDLILSRSRSGSVTNIVKLGEPDLLAGSNSPRPIMKKAGEQ